MAMILEVLDPRSGAVRFRVPLDQSPVRIGRGLDNDIILDDPYAESAHARIAPDGTGAVVVEDLGSVNRILIAASGERVDRAIGRPGTELRIGRTPIRFRDASESLPPAIPDTAHHRWRWLRTLDSTPGRLATVGLAMLGFGVWVWLSSYERSAASDAFAAVIGIGIVAAIWAGIWAVGGRIVVHRFRFLGHLALFCLAGAAGVLVTEASAWGEFVFPDNALWAVAGMAAGWAIMAALIAGHLRLASSMASTRRWVTGVAVAGLLFALGGVATLLEDDTFTDVPQFSGVLKPAAWVPTLTPAEFRGVAGELRLEVDALQARLDDGAEDGR